MGEARTSDPRLDGDGARTEPLPSDPLAWDRWIEAIGPASMLVLIGGRMSAELRVELAPDDIWQEALLRAWRGRERFEWRGLASFRRWLLEIAERCIWDAADRVKAQKRAGAARTLPIGAASSSVSNERALPLFGSTTPSRIAIHREQSLAMQEALASLPEELR